MPPVRYRACPPARRPKADNQARTGRAATNSLVGMLLLKGIDDPLAGERHRGIRSELRPIVGRDVVGRPG